MRFLILTLLLVAPGCVAYHKIVMESEPPGVHVEMNGEYLGETPIVYILESRYAETIWPDEARFVARTAQGGWKPEVKQFEARSHLPGRIFFMLERDSSAPVAETPDAQDGAPAVDAGEGLEYETLEEQKRRLSGKTEG